MARKMPVLSATALPWRVRTIVRLLATTHVPGPPQTTMTPWHGKHSESAEACEEAGGSTEAGGGEEAAEEEAAEEEASEEA